MHRLRLFAITIDDVRDIFGAEEGLAARLRGIAPQRVARERPQRPLLERIGPLFSRNRATEVDARAPLPADVEAMLAGGHITTERMPQSWELLLLWLAALSASDLVVEFDDLDALEFDLARAGLPSTFSLHSLASRELGIPLHPLQGQVVGYSKHCHVVEASRQLRRVRGDAGSGSTTTMGLIDPLLVLLEGIAQRPERALDLVVIQIPT